MNDFRITATRNIEQAAQRLEALERYAQRRAELIDTLDLDALGPNPVFQIFEDDDALSWELASGHLYLHHLADMQTLGMQLAEPMRLAA
jgi:hypothetical protein